MKTSAFSQAGLLLLGGTAVLLIGALVKFDPAPPPVKPVTLAAPALPPEPAEDDSLDDPGNQPLPANFPAALAQVVKLTRAGVREDVITAFVENSKEPLTPTADEIIYLHQVGVAESVTAALVRQKAKAPTPLIEPVTNQPAPETEETSVAANPAPTPPRASPGGDAASFYNDLAPYGKWVENTDYGWAWQPTVVEAVPDWRPYRDNGQWEYTDAGWYWQSDYPWGWAAFHYGRWFNDPAQGWLWQPGNRWAPAWVTWRKSTSHFGWAPLPPGVSFNVEFTLLQEQHLPAYQADFGLTPSSYTFVPAAHFLSRNLAKFTTPAQKAPALVAASRPVNQYKVVNAVVHNVGLQPQEVAAAVHMPVTPLTLRDAPAPPQRKFDLGAQELAVYRPARLPAEAARPVATSTGNAANKTTK
ncbi:MAG TPA: DUF6600 domain-containing protein [Verrucomicrobiae bacterium]|jgi:hypothetical protein|nr:DUF6600 domain-containing protein [Verrucomicrobiae bacterium]